MTIRELCEKRANLVAQARALLDAAQAENRDLNAEESEQFDRIHGDIAAVKTQIDREERVAAEEQALGAPMGTPFRPDPQGEPRDEAEMQAQRNLQGFRLVLTRGKDALYSAEMRALQADLDVSGGYLVAPQSWSANLIKGLDNAVYMRQLANVLPALTKADSLGVPTLDTDIGDVTWTTELGTGSEDSSMAFGKRELSPHPLARRIKVSNKLLRASAINVEDLVRERMGYKFGTVQENAFLNGSGAGQPLGVMVASDDGVSTSRDVSTDNAETAITADGLMNCMFHLKPQYRRTASWMFHTDAVKAISKLKDGESNYIWHVGLRGGMPDTLLTRPVYESQYMPNTFTTGLYVGILGDFKAGYWIVDALSVSIQVLTELYATTNQTGYIGRLECDGMPVLAEAFARVTLA